MENMIRPTRGQATENDLYSAYYSPDQLLLSIDEKTLCPLTKESIVEIIKQGREVAMSPNGDFYDEVAIKASVTANKTDPMTHKHLLVDELTDVTHKLETIIGKQFSEQLPPPSFT